MNENQPLAKQLSSIPVRKWAIDNAEAVFEEFKFRFGKEHASEVRYRELVRVIQVVDNPVHIGSAPVRFTFVAKGSGVFFGKTMSQALKLYRAYYLHKVKTMLLPAVWTRRDPPEWLNLSSK